MTITLPPGRSVAGCLMLLLLAFMARPLPGQQPSPFQQWVADCERIVFLGDSITWSGQYVAEFDAWLYQQNPAAPPQVLNLGLPSETVSGLSEAGHAGGRFPRPDLAERLDRVLEKTSPDLVIACYGINCGIYQPFDESRFQKYQQGLQKLKDATAAVGANLILLTPPVYDDQRVEKSFSYNGVMQRYAEWLVAQREQGWQVVDLHSAMAKELARQRQTDPDFTFQPDAVHPGDPGHQLIARTLIQWLDPESPLPARKTALFQQRMKIRRDAWLKETGHQRPGLPQGSDLQEAERRCEEITRKIEERWPR